ncbi:MAG: cysteine--tRNA ligase [Saprospiraceae bacterium]|nr:cysteine--tRNA ligase [Saprospiraceae bacterium]MDW8483424.1 cysteine--tRNA ligase [Saprospiraceae bacterium]
MKTAQRTLRISNTLSGKKEIFTPLHEGLVGMYVCGPTVYNNVHLGNCRTFTSFDIIYRYLLHLGYRVRYVRNITDVGHLTDDGEDRMAQGARLHKLEPMEVAQRYTLDFHEVMRMLNNLPPSIEPRATGHIPEQIEMVQRILERGYAYERNGSVYFNVRKFIAENPGIYGRLSGRVVEELIAESRENLKGQEEKDHPADFALWMKARPGDLMIWKSPWSVGFPGWHLECSVMSTKYLGQTFDIHGGGGDLKFPHHENEIAQNYGACGCSPARYWIHTNMLQLNGAKMSKSEGNFITPEQLFTGTSSLLSKAYSPMVLRYYFLQAHYASVLDMTEEGLRAAEKAYNKMMETNQLLQSLPVNTATYDGSESAHDRAILRHIEAAYEGMDDDFNTAIALAHLNELCSYVHKIAHRQIPLDDVSPWVIERLKTFFRAFLFDIFGLRDERQHANGNHLVEGLMALILDIRAAARAQKDWNTSDKIRDALAALGIALKDGKDGTTWTRL